MSSKTENPHGTAIHGESTKTFKLSQGYQEAPRNGKGAPFRYGANFKIVGKCDPQKLSYAGAWEQVTGTFQDLAGHIAKGHPWMPALLNGNGKRWQVNANDAELLAIDVDDGMTIEQFLEHPLAEHCGLGIESASSKPEHNKFRAVFRYSRPIEGWETIRTCQKYMLTLMPVADGACKDASRYFFGAPRRKPFLLNESAYLPESFVEDALAWHQEQERIEQERAEHSRRQWQEWLEANPDRDKKAEVLEALKYCDPDCDYESSWVGIGMTLVALFGPSEGADLWHQWSQGARRDDHAYRHKECHRRAKTFRNPDAREGQLFSIAREGGFKPPWHKRSTPIADDFDQADRQRQAEEESLESAQRLHQLERQAEQQAEQLQALELRAITALQDFKQAADRTLYLQPLIDAKVAHLVALISFGKLNQDAAIAAISEWAKANKVSASLAKKTLSGVFWPQQETQGDLKYKRAYQSIERVFAERLRFNNLTKQVELDGEEFDPSTAKIFLEIDHDFEVKANQESVAAMVIRLAKENTYHPVAQYLQSVSDRYGDDTSILVDLAARYFGPVDYIHEVMLFRWLISCVARAMEPGCKVDTALILQGKQELGKSLFFATLASQDWFADDYCSDSNNKDEKLKIHLVWMMEWGELERVFRRNDISRVKAFITTRDDLVRPPYARNTERMKRSSVIVGSTNEQQFLVDTTGNRRFWVIPVTKQIDIKRLESERDRIWAAAVHLHKIGESWELKGDEKGIAAESRAQYEYRDAWFDDIASLVEFKDVVSLAEVFKHLGVEVAHKDAAKNKRAGNVLTQLGFVQQPNPVMHEGEKRRVWKKSPSPSVPDNGSPESLS